eukprot:403341-Hanusia_phi.AAC.1
MKNVTSQETFAECQDQSRASRHHNRWHYEAVKGTTISAMSHSSTCKYDLEEREALVNDLAPATPSDLERC